MNYMNVNTEYFTSDIAVGGKGGSPFYFNFHEGKPPVSSTVVLSLQAWYDAAKIRAIEIGLTHPFEGRTKALFGKKENQVTPIFYLLSDERITSFKIWSSNDRVRRIEIKTSGNRSFNAGPGPDGELVEYEVGAGLLIGAFGGSGDDLDRLGFALLRKVVKTELVDVSYPGLEKISIQTSPKIIKTIVYDNSKSSADQSYKFAGSQTIGTSGEWSVSAGIEASVSTSMSVSAGIPMFGEASATASASLSVSTQSTQTRSVNKTSEESYECEITVPAGKKVRVSAVQKEGKIDAPYKGKMQFTLDSTKIFEYDVSGTYNGVAASEMNISNEAVDPK